MLVLIAIIIAIIVVIAFLALPIYLISYAERCTTRATCKVITVFIVGVRQVQNPDDIFSDGDYYAAVKIGRDAFQSFREECLQGTVLNTRNLDGWTFITTVPDNRPDRNVPITIRLFDADDDFGAAASDDTGLDINPRDGIQQITLNFNMDGLPFMVNDVTGDGDLGNLQLFLFEGGQAARILFDVQIEPLRPRGGETVLNPVPAPLANCK